MTSLTTGDEESGIPSKELLQRLWIPTSDHTNRIGGLVAFLTLPEVLPKVRQMVESVRIKPLFHCIGPLLVRDGHVSNRPSDGSPESFGHLFYCWSLADESVRVLRRQPGISQQGCGYARYVFRADEWNDGSLLAPRQEGGALLGD